MLTPESLRSTRETVALTSVIPPFAQRIKPKLFTGVVLVKPVPTTVPKSFIPFGDMLNTVPLLRVAVSGKKLNWHEACWPADVNDKEMIERARLGATRKG